MGIGDGGDFHFPVKVAKPRADMPGFKQAGRCRQADARARGRAGGQGYGGIREFVIGLRHAAARGVEGVGGAAP